MIITTAAITGLVAWSVFYEPLQINVNRYPIRSPALASLAGLELVVLGDMHTGGPLNGIARLHRIVDAANAAGGDAIILLGDYVYHGMGKDKALEVEEICAALGRLRAPMGVFAVLGNHDWWDDVQRLQRALEAEEIALMDERAARLDYRGAPLWLAGVSDLWEGPCDIGGTLNKVEDDAPVILMCHNPDAFVDVPERVGLTLSGHTHGGQIRLPLIGRRVPSRFGERFAEGHVVEGGRHLFVTRGLGTSLAPVRLGVPPEIAVMVIEG